MEELKPFLIEAMEAEFLGAVISNPRKKGGIKKIKARPVKLRGGLFVQLESFTEKQVFHENASMTDAAGRLYTAMEGFGQLELETKNWTATVLASKKGKVRIQKKYRKAPAACPELSHNRKKKYILPEGRYVPYLFDLGVMTAEGKIVKGQMDKFRQINRFLEFIEDILPELPADREVTILDFGCGKSYLTFAMYDYLHEIKHYDVRIIGLDLKKDVIRRCASLAEKYGYGKLAFLEGDIAAYENTGQVDMVVTLHACDTATDYALAKAVGWKAKVILSVPCCQHELNMQMNKNPQDFLRPVMHYGLIQERMAALLTDALRAERLSGFGYDTQILEFIDMEHTPKNILIRAVYRGRKKENGKQLSDIEEFFQVEPLLGKLLKGE